MMNLMMEELMQGEESWSAGDDGVAKANNDVVDEGQVQAGVEVVVEGVDGGQEEDDGVHNFHVYKKKKPSERILKLKLKKILYNKYGSCSNATNPIKLDYLGSD